MSTAYSDPLLAIAKVATIIVRVGLVVGMVGTGIAGTVALIGPEAFGDHMQVKMTPDGLHDTAWAIALVLVTAMLSLGLMYDFVARLAKIIDTVGEGDPFTADNAARLMRMGWLALAVQLLALPVTLVSTWIGSRVSEDVFKVQSDFSFTGFGLALVLFILARVFARGAQMREDLEGTV